MRLRVPSSPSAGRRYASTVIAQVNEYFPESTLQFTDQWYVALLRCAAPAHPTQRASVCVRTIFTPSTIPADLTSEAGKAWEKDADAKAALLIAKYGAVGHKRRLVEVEIPSKVKVGHRIEVYWPADSKYYPATITACHDNGTKSVLYDDQSAAPPVSPPIS